MRWQEPRPPTTIIHRGIQKGMYNLFFISHRLHGIRASMECELYDARSFSANPGSSHLSVRTQFRPQRGLIFIRRSAGTKSHGGMPDTNDGGAPMACFRATGASWSHHNPAWPCFISNMRHCRCGRWVTVGPVTRLPHPR